MNGTEAKPKKAKKRGRPKGSKNIDVTVKTPSRRCPHCKSTDVVLNGALKVSDYHGTTTEGEPYTSTTWHAARCKSCGGRMLAMVRRFDPKLWTGAKP